MNWTKLTQPIQCKSHTNPPIYQLKVNHALTKVMPIQCQSEDVCVSNQGTSVLWGLDWSVSTEDDSTNKDWHSNANVMSIQCQSHANRWPSRNYTGNKCTMGTDRSVLTEDISDNKFMIRRHSIWLTLTNPLAIHDQSANSMSILCQSVKNICTIKYECCQSLTHLPILD